MILAIKNKSGGRGTDFKQRFKASRWAEDRLHEALTNRTHVSIRLGASKVTKYVMRTPEEMRIKEPDLLILSTAKLSDTQLKKLKDKHYDLSDITPELLKETSWSFLREAAIFAVEVEFSPYKSTVMKGRKWKKRPIGSTRKIAKEAKPPIAPNIWVKCEDIPRLERWQKDNKVPIFVFHVFDKEAFGIDLTSVLTWKKQLDKLDGDDLVRMQQELGVFYKVQNYNRSDQEAASEKKAVIIISPAASIKIAEVENVTVSAQKDLSKSGKYVSQIIFRHGHLDLLPELWTFVKNKSLSN